MMMAVIKVQSIRDIPKDGVNRVEATNKLYRQGNDRILKIFLDCYQRIDSESGRDIFKVLELLMSLEGSRSLILPEDIYLGDKRIYGYTTKYLKGANLNYISREVKLKDLLEAYLELTKDIKLLAENNINIFDIHAGNLLYNGSLYMLDFDLSKVDTVNSADKMYKRAAYQVFQQILRVIVWFDKSQDLYTVLNHYHIRDFNLGALQCGIIDITSSVEEFKESLFSLGLDDKCTLKDVDILLRRKRNGY